MWCVSGVWIKTYYSRVACMYMGGYILQCHKHLV
jgi:hypothetical protein